MQYLIDIKFSMILYEYTLAIFWIETGLFKDVLKKYHVSFQQNDFI